MANVSMDIALEDIVGDLLPHDLLAHVEYSDIIAYMREKNGIAEIAQRLAEQAGLTDRATVVLKAILARDLSVAQEIAANCALVALGDAEGIM